MLLYSVGSDCKEEEGKLSCLILRLDPEWATYHFSQFYFSDCVIRVAKFKGEKKFDTLWVDGTPCAHRERRK